MKLYKKVFVNLAKVLPDSIYLRMVFFSKLKRKLDLSNPKSYNEKLNWLIINDRKEHYQIMVDKYEAKKYVAGLTAAEKESNKKVIVEYSPTACSLKI